MTKLFLILAGVYLVILRSCPVTNDPGIAIQPCHCDTPEAKRFVTSKEFNRIPQYDNATFSADDFYDLDSGINRMLWYRDVENPDPTKFTSSWNDYFPNNYRASQLDFVKFYTGKKDIELAFQFGPNSDLWAYHIFVIRKIDCCYLVTRSYFRHARFTYKAYGIMNGHQLDSLYSILAKIQVHTVLPTEEFKYRGYFMDNRNKRSFFIELEDKTGMSANKEQKTKPQIKALYDFVDDKIMWTRTYIL